MLSRPLHLPPEHLYPTDEWRVRETRYSDRDARGATVRAMADAYWQS